MTMCQAGPGKEATMQVCMPWGSFLSPVVNEFSGRCQSGLVETQD